MKPYLHSQVSVKKFGGKPEDYQKIHDWFDQTKAHVPDMRHRSILHNSFGIYLAEQMFGINIENSDGKKISVRDIGEQHVLDDLGFIPTLQDYLKGMPYYDWLNGKKTVDDIPKSEAKRRVFDGTAFTLKPFGAPEPEWGNGHLTQAEIDALLMGANDHHDDIPGSIKQSDIDRMLNAIARQDWSKAVQLEFDFFGENDVVPMMAPESEQAMPDFFLPSIEEMVCDGNHEPVYDD